MPERSELLREAIRLAVESVERGGGPFGALVAREGRVVGRGHNRVVLDSDPTAHAEMMALREAARELGTPELEGCELYASCEPCPMCLGALLWAGVRTVHFGCTRADAAAAGFADERLHDALRRSTLEPHLTLRPMLREDARVAFRAWEAKADRVPYGPR